MRGHFSKSLLAVGVFSFCGMFSTAAAGQLVNGWSIAVGANGAITSMTHEDPSTPLSIEKTLAITIDKGINASGGSVTFKNGLQRDLGQQEAASYLDMLGGIKAIWDFYSQTGHLNTATVDANSQSLSASFYGAIARVTFASGNSIIGKVQAGTDKATITVTSPLGQAGGPVTVNLSTIKTIQTIKL